MSVEELRALLAMVQQQYESARAEALRSEGEIRLLTRLIAGLEEFPVEVVD